MKKTICLNMIVKNESHIIESTLHNILDHLPIDYWIISDTGSTDDTMEIITNFFKEKDIPGELFQDEWKDFGYNRTKALEYAFNKTDYVFIFDADDLIHGDFILPIQMDKDKYEIPFENPVFYYRPILVSNKMKWKYNGVLHEYIVNVDPIQSEEHLYGNYYIESRRLGDRSKNPDKYLNDAMVLKKGFFDENDDIGLKNRYAYYCAQSYQDAGKYERAIEWFEKTLTLDYSAQYKYYACIRCGDCYNELKQYDKAIIIWCKSYDYDNERLEGIVKTMEYYYNKDIHFMVSILYNKFKHISLDNIDKSNKIFLDQSKYIELHYYASISGCYCNEHKSAYEACKYLLLNKWKFIENAISNLQFYITQFKQDPDKKPLVDFLIYYFNNGSRSIEERENVWKIIKDIIKDEYPDKYDLLEKSISKKNIDKNSKYATSNKILVYTGWMTHLWNESHLENKALGGSEKAVAYLMRELPKNYEIIVSGNVEEGLFDNVTYIHQNKLQDLLDKTDFHTIIISRNISFLTEYNNLNCFQLILSLHDTHILNNGNNANPLLDMYNDNIDKFITLTPWHKSNLVTLYPSINPDKIKIINNGIDVSQFNDDNSNNKTKNKFIWSSRSERGLHILLNIWREIIDKLPDATLDICSYGDFPKDNADNEMMKIINNFDSITHHGKLNTNELYDLMNKSEYWLYTNTFPETSCITAMEMLMSEVICLYYPIAGLNDTIGDYGIPVNQGDEIKTLINLTTEKKARMREKGKEYALSCSWKNRAYEWSSILGLNKKKWIFYCHPHYEKKMIQLYIDNLNYIYPDYYIYLTNDKNRILTENPSKITFVFEVFDGDILTKLPNTEFSMLGTEPLNIPLRLRHIMDHLKIYPNMKYYDYSKSNLKILEENGINIQDKIYLPYKCSDDELKKLINLNKNTKKEFDFGIIKSGGGDVTDRRLKIVNFLKKNNFSVNIMGGWGNDRDMELAKCKIILNIHGFYQIPSNIFEHIRCNRLLEAGFNILSETNYKLDTDFVNKYPNLKQIEYSDFLNIDIINNMLPKNICFIHSCHLKNKGLKRLEYLIDKIKTTGLIHHLETIYINNIGIPIQENIYGDKFKICNYSDNPVLYEIPTINKIHQFSKENTNYNILYLHTKGISYDDNKQKENDWIDMMLYFIIDRFKLCVEKMSSGIQAVGCNYYDDEMKIRNPKHFSGNFWWANSQYISELPSLIEKTDNVNPTDAEYWLCQNNPSIYEPHNSKINHYMDVYPSNNYCSSDIQPKIVDCFIFYNELEMLTYRLNILNDTVDYFVLVESIHTFVGKEKSLFYQENKQLFEKFNHKIIHIIVDDFPHKYPNINIKNDEQWINERYQRDCISRGLDKLSLQNNDVITITDLDEIPNPKILEQIKNNEIVVDINILEMDFYYYNLNSKMDHLWHHAKMFTFKKYNELNIECDKIRFYNCPIIKNAGWHLSYFGNEKFIKNKLENFSHQEYNKVEFVDEKLIEQRVKSGKDLFDRPTSIINIPIEDNDNLPPAYDIYLTNFYKTQLTQTNKNIGFFIRHFTERGTEVATYDYAHYNEKILQNKSYIIHFSDDVQKKYGFPDIKDSFPKFNSRFEMIEINDITDMKQIREKYKLDFFYTLTGGGQDIYKFDNKYIWDKCKTIKHCVFDTLCPEGDYNLSISNHLNNKNNTSYTVLPHMVDLPNTDTHLRNELNIPEEAIVLGRYGGFHQFDLAITHNAIKQFLDSNKSNNVYFLFMNTFEFYSHPNIIYLDKNIDLLYKTKFINTCNVMIHARSDGETFGLAIAEFSIKNKPIITCPCGDLEHILLLGDKAITYNNTEELLDIFSNIKELFSQHSDWNCYREYTPEKVMNIFDNILSNYKLETNIVTINNVEFKFFKDDDLAKSSIALNMPWESHITSFVEYYNKYFPIQNIIDIGANFGYHSLLFSKYVKNKVFSFEPQEQNYNLLSFNINFNNIKNICSYKMACGEENDTIKMPIVENYNNSINMGDFTPNIINKHNFTYVKSVKLDYIDFPPIDIIKIDVQGWEKKVLKGSYNLLQHHKPILIIEFEEYQLNKLNESCKNLIEYIRENNYYIFYLDYKYPSDHICVHNDKLNEFKKCFNSVISTHTQDNNINHNILYNINEKIKI